VEPLKNLRRRCHRARPTYPSETIYTQSGVLLYLASPDGWARSYVCGGMGVLRPERSAVNWWPATPSDKVKHYG
jgi:hypothetical protein